MRMSGQDNPCAVCVCVLCVYVWLLYNNDFVSECALTHLLAEMHFITPLNRCRDVI